jgi:hypothetical protein
MCDPVSISLASTAIGAVGSVASSMGAASAAKKQAREVSAWQQEQKKFRQQESLRQEDLRQKADQSRQEGLQQLTAEDQSKRQSDEEARLAAELTGQGQQQPTAEAGAPISVADKELTDVSSQTNSDVFKSDLARKINEATTGARQRLGALARVSSYGQSFGGLGRGNQEILNKSGAGIDQYNEFRRGSLGAFGTEKSIEPVQVTYTPGVGDALAQAALSFGTQGLGNLSGGATGGIAKAATKSITDPWAGLRTALPKTAPIPTPRVF